MTKNEIAEYSLSVITEYATNIQKQLGDETETTLRKMEQFKATAADLSLMLGQVLIRAMAGVIGVAEEVYGAFLHLQAGTAGFLANITSLTDLLHITKGASKQFWSDAAAD